MIRFDPSLVVDEPERQGQNNERFVRHGAVRAAVRKQGDPAVALVRAGWTVMVLPLDAAVDLADALVDAVEAAGR